MTAPNDIAAERGISRRSVLSRGAAGLGIALTGSLNGLFGTTASAHGAARPCFSDDKQTPFANIQSPGHVLAIQGPWRRPR